MAAGEPDGGGRSAEIHGQGQRRSAEQREEQRRSFAYGNTAFENKLITREMVDREAEKLAKEKNERDR